MTQSAVLYAGRLAKGQVVTYLASVLRYIGPPEFYARWLAIIGAASLLAAILSGLHMSVNQTSLWTNFSFLATLVAIAVALATVNRYAGRLTGTVVDILLALAQVVSIALLFTSLTYVAAAVGAAIPL